MLRYFLLLISIIIIPIFAIDPGTTKLVEVNKVNLEIKGDYDTNQPTGLYLIYEGDPNYYYLPEANSAYKSTLAFIMSQISNGI